MESLRLNCERCWTSSQTASVITNSPIWSSELAVYKHLAFVSVTPSLASGLIPLPAHVTFNWLHIRWEQPRIYYSAMEHHWRSTLSKRGCITFISSAIWNLWERTPFKMTPGFIHGGVTLGAYKDNLSVCMAGKYFKTTALSLYTYYFAWHWQEHCMILWLRNKWNERKRHSIRICILLFCPTGPRI